MNDADKADEQADEQTIEPILGIVGGSGLYQLEMSDARQRDVDTPWGKPSAPPIEGLLEGRRCVFLARHGEGHKFSPSEINYRANIAALKSLGVTDLTSLSACGSLREALAPGDFVTPDQFIDRTVGRASTFFDQGCVAHVSLASPTSSQLRGFIADAAQRENIPIRDRGTYVAMEGPQFSTRAESRMYRAWGGDVIGMTNMPEAKLAREAEICYATIAMVSDYDCWRSETDSVDVPEILRVMKGNLERANRLIRALAKSLPERRPLCPSGADRALDAAILTAPSAIDPEARKRLRIVAERVL